MDTISIRPMKLNFLPFTCLFFLFATIGIIEAKWVSSSAGNSTWPNQRGNYNTGSTPYRPQNTLPQYNSNGAHHTVPYATVQPPRYNGDANSSSGYGYRSSTPTPQNWARPGNTGTQYYSDLYSTHGQNSHGQRYNSTNSGMRQPWNPGYNNGTRQPPNSGYNSGTGQSWNPAGYNSGTGQTLNPGYNSGSGQSWNPAGYNSGSGQASNPGYNSGTGQSWNPAGYNSGTGQTSNPGYNSGSGQSWTPAGYNSGTGQASNPGYNNGSGQTWNPGYNSGTGQTWNGPNEGGRTTSPRLYPSLAYFSEPNRNAQPGAGGQYGSQNYGQSSYQNGQHYRR